MPATVDSSSSSGRTILSRTSFDGASRQGTWTWRVGFWKPDGNSSIGMLTVATVPKTTIVSRIIMTVIRRSKENRGRRDSRTVVSGISGVVDSRFSSGSNSSSPRSCSALAGVARTARDRVYGP